MITYHIQRDQFKEALAALCNQVVSLQCKNYWYVLVEQTLRLIAILRAVLYSSEILNYTTSFRLNWLLIYRKTLFLLGSCLSLILTLKNLYHHLYITLKIHLRYWDCNILISENMISNIVSFEFIVNRSYSIFGILYMWLK